MASDGDPRVLFVMNLVLSAAFASVLVWGLSYLDLATFTLRTVAGYGLVVFVVTYVAVLR
ncbi:hypothetical protein [Halobaculum limi]|uniref:hypothetical protein n=1 Tax=Halobaculum limi TaxID=3031916 RepID=UPI002406CC28|nr:hypothetical protein [Halobaculum sp. YSMS11]